MRWLYALIMVFAPLTLAAQELPGPMAAQIQRDPEKFLDDLAVLIAGYGTGDAIDAQGLQNVVAMARADGRALGFRRLQGADLDGDGAIEGGEMRIKAAASAAGARGRLIVNFGHADTDGNDSISAVEMQAYANAVGLESFSQERALSVYALMGFDKNGDGRLTLDEARSALALASAKGAPARMERNL